MAFEAIKKDSIQTDDGGSHFIFKKGGVPFSIIPNRKPKNHHHEVLFSALYRLFMGEQAALSHLIEGEGRVIEGDCSEVLPFFIDYHTLSTQSLSSDQSREKEKVVKALEKKLGVDFPPDLLGPQGIVFDEEGRIATQKGLANLLLRSVELEEGDLHARNMGVAFYFTEAELAVFKKVVSRDVEFASQLVETKQADDLQGFEALTEKEQRLKTEVLSGEQDRLNKKVKEILTSHLKSFLKEHLCWVRLDYEYSFSSITQSARPAHFSSGYAISPSDIQRFPVLETPPFYWPTTVTLETELLNIGGRIEGNAYTATDQKRFEYLKGDLVFKAELYQALLARYCLPDQYSLDLINVADLEPGRKTELRYSLLSRMAMVRWSALQDLKFREAFLSFVKAAEEKERVIAELSSHYNALGQDFFNVPEQEDEQKGLAETDFSKALKAMIAQWQKSTTLLANKKYEASYFTTAIDTVDVLIERFYCLRPEPVRLTPEIYQALETIVSLSFSPMGEDKRQKEMLPILRKLRAQSDNSRFLMEYACELTYQRLKQRLEEKFPKSSVAGPFETAAKDLLFALSLYKQHSEESLAGLLTAGEMAYQLLDRPTAARAKACIDHAKYVSKNHCWGRRMKIGMTLAVLGVVALIALTVVLALSGVGLPAAIMALTVVEKILAGVLAGTTLISAGYTTYRFFRDPDKVSRKLDVLGRAGERALEPPAHRSEELGTFVEPASATV